MATEFDLDVASPGKQHVPWDTRSQTLHRNSLKRKWEGFLWMNAPYRLRNGMLDWIDKFIQHANGVTLVPDFTLQNGGSDSQKVLNSVRESNFCPERAGKPIHLEQLWPLSGKREPVRFKQPRSTDSECVFGGNRFGPCAEVEPVIPASMRDEAEDRPRSHSPL